MANSILKTLAITVALSSSAMAYYNNNGYGLTANDVASNSKAKASNNWGPFLGGSTVGPLNSSSNWGPFNGLTNWGPFANNNDMVNDSDWGFHYSNKNTTKNKSTAVADGQASGTADANMKAVADAYAKGQADAYAKAQADAYTKGYADGMTKGFVAE